MFSYNQNNCPSYNLVNLTSPLLASFSVCNPEKGNAIEKSVHINSCKPFHAMQVAQVAVWTVEDEEVVDRKELRLQGEELSVHQSNKLRKCLEKWSKVLSDKAGMTEVVCHDICTGHAPPVRSVPHQIPERWTEQVREELLALVELGILVSSSSQ